MLFSLLYLVVRTIFRLTPASDGFDRDLEIMVLRHQVKVLRRKQGRPRLRRAGTPSSRTSAGASTTSGPMSDPRLVSPTRSRNWPS